mmetsp:Transcript_43425/g.70461  ORF Transcript_43425/g.70461 Transcript_43425/m.70461 type:complete len:231 (+) Transcript_43425:116-808(+)|eukprot:CAMPEP_0184663504 /NCGR_PEP_ID=MMETSP0308-20130426/48380_1 /TAXON_ID=38269 /ORGANISM="Gloeochaete witrockiana, Strain SAG 46.84" /LENGTH=230 /DNA_ID=CAMNT_0027106273 /DNA_START=45 /DNA_END=737 /DNA_ORIENTATION=+
MPSFVTPIAVQRRWGLNVSETFSTTSHLSFRGCNGILVKSALNSKKSHMFRRRFVVENTGGDPVWLDDAYFNLPNLSIDKERLIPYPSWPFMEERVKHLLVGIAVYHCEIHMRSFDPTDAARHLSQRPDIERLLRSTSSHDEDSSSSLSDGASLSEERKVSLSPPASASSSRSPAASAPFLSENNLESAIPYPWADHSKRSIHLLTGLALYQMAIDSSEEVSVPRGSCEY